MTPRAYVRWSAILLLAWSLIPVTVQAADCPGSSIPLTTSAPAVESLRAYRYGMSSPIRLAVDARGSVYVTDPRRGQLIVRGASGEIVQHRRDLGRPGAIAVANSGSVYIADLDRAEIDVFDGNWQPLLTFGGDDLQQPADMALDGAGERLYVSDSEAHRIVVYSSAGEHLFTFGERGDGAGQFEYPSGIHVDAVAREVLVSDQFGFRVQVFDLDGTYQYCIGGSSANPGGFFQRGRLLSAPQGMWTDTLGRIYVADSFDGQVKVIDRNGRLLSRIGTFGSATGELRQPTDVVMDSFGRLFVASSNNARIEMYGVDAYSDPEQITPALLRTRSSLVQAGSSGSFSIFVEVPGYRLSSLQPDSIRVNGLPPVTAQLVDADGDALPELRLGIGLAELLATLPGSGPADIRFTAAMPILDVVGTLPVNVLPEPVTDNDGDGVPNDIDQCADTTISAFVDSVGCALQQLCRCDDFQRHHRYRKCLKQTTRDWLREGLIDRKQRKRMVKQARRQDCAQHDRHDDDDDDDDRDEHEHEHEHEQNDGRGKDRRKKQWRADR